MDVDVGRECLRRVELSAEEIHGLRRVRIAELVDGRGRAPALRRPRAAALDALVRAVHHPTAGIAGGLPDWRDLPEVGAGRLPAPARSLHGSRRELAPRDA